MSELQQFWQVTKDCYKNASLKTKALMAGDVTSGLAFTGATFVLADALRNLSDTIADNYQTGSQLLTATSGDITQTSIATAFSIASLYAAHKLSNEAYLSLRSDLTAKRVSAKLGL